MMDCMKRFISTLLVASMMASTAPAWADEPTPVVTPLTKGQPAPYIGVLLSPEAVAQVIAQKDTAARAMALAVQHQADLDAIQLRFEVDRLTSTFTADKKILQAQVDDGKKQITILQDQLKKQTSGPSAPVWVGLGVAGGVVLTLATVFVVSQATK